MITLTPVEQVSLAVTNAATLSNNLTVGGVANVASHLNVGGNTAVSGLTTGTSYYVSHANTTTIALSRSPPLIKLPLMRYSNS